MFLAFGWSDLAYLALAVFLLAAGVAFAYIALRLGGTLGRTTSLIKGTERELLPVITKLGGTVDRVNDQLDKVDQMTDSAVDAVASVDTAVRTVTGLVTRPVSKLAGIATGARHAASSIRTRGSWRDAIGTGQEEAARRERQLADELEEAE
jgi:uncharacterized protein YoxC